MKRIEFLKENKNAEIEKKYWKTKYGQEERELIQLV